MEKRNENAWNLDTFKAWVERFGEPATFMEVIKKDPFKRVKDIFELGTDFKGKKVLNLMGSNGNRAVALTVLGAEVTVVDYSEGNAAYAMNLAEAGGISIDYKCMRVEDFEPDFEYDYVFAEMGILHYFTDLSLFFGLCYRSLKENGKCIVKDFHPVSTKLISSRGHTAKIRKHKVDGDYFSTALVEKKVAFSKYSTGAVDETVYLRQWTLGEIVTSAAGSGFWIETLEENPNQSSEQFDKGIPKTFILRAEKRSV
jgi:2-polyprenyl-3-methyl-5-hydroxy-6-metoxy-1,4-benzoquinol methylase